MNALYPLLTTENTLTERLMAWLHMAIDTDEETVRPVLSYGCIQMFRGKRIAVGCDSFHMNVVWLDDKPYGNGSIDAHGNELLLFEDSWTVRGGDYSSMKYPLVKPVLASMVGLPSFEVEPQALYQWVDHNSDRTLAVLLSPDVETMKLEVLNGQPPDGARSFPIVAGTPRYGSALVDAFLLMHALHGFFHEPTVEIRIDAVGNKVAVGTPGKAFAMVMGLNREYNPWSQNK